MKHVIVVLAVMFATSANATDTIAVSEAFAGVTVGGQTVDVPKVASSAVAPSTYQGSVCPIVSPSSKAASVFFFSGSGTTGTTVNGICVAWHQRDEALIQRIACDEDAGYRRAQAKLGRNTCD